MKWIDQKKIPSWAVILVLAVSFGYAGWQTTRGILAYLSYSYPEFGQTAVFFNDIVAVIIGGLVPLLFYELITAFTARFVSMRLGGIGDDLRYALRFFYIAANLVIGSLKFLYLLSPALSVFGEVWVDFFVTTAFFALYLVYAAKHYVPSPRWGAMTLSVGGTYLIVEAVVMAFGLLQGVLL